MRREIANKDEIFSAERKALNASFAVRQRMLFAAIAVYKKALAAAKAARKKASADAEAAHKKALAYRDEGFAEERRALTEVIEAEKRVVDIAREEAAALMALSMSGSLSRRAVYRLALARVASAIPELSPHELDAFKAGMPTPNARFDAAMTETWLLGQHRDALAACTVRTIRPRDAR